MGAETDDRDQQGEDQEGAPRPASEGEGRWVPEAFANVRGMSAKKRRARLKRRVENVTLFWVMIFVIVVAILALAFEIGRGDMNHGEAKIEDH